MTVLIIHQIKIGLTEIVLRTFEQSLGSRRMPTYFYPPAYESLTQV
jgi:hypothetical protein